MTIICKKNLFKILIFQYIQEPIQPNKTYSINENLSILNNYLEKKKKERKI